MDQDKKPAGDSQPIAPVHEKSMEHHTHSTFQLWMAGFFIFITFGVGFLGGWLGSSVREEGGVGNQAIEIPEFISEESELISAVAENVGPSVVSITVQSQTTYDSYFYGNQTYESSSAGTGIILSEDGMIVTNKHVIDQDTTELSVVLSDGTEYNEIDILGRDPFNDIAFIKIRNASGLTPASLGNSADMRVGEKVVAIGNALGQYTNTVTTGIISATGRPVLAGDASGANQLQNLFQTDAAINPGNSGGPLVNLRGEVIGINTAVAGNAEGIGFAIPIDDVKPGIESIETNGELVRPYLGVRYVPITDDLVAEFGLDEEKGALIIGGEDQDAVLPDSPADKAGLQENDVILKVGDTDINEDNSLVTTVSKYQVGDTITLEVSRDGEVFNVDVLLEAVPESVGN